MTLLDVALLWHSNGCAPVPTKTDGSKAPAITWKSHQDHQPTAEQVRTWFSGDHDGLGLLTGAASDGLEMFELEGRAVAEGILDRLAVLMADHGYADLWDRLNAGYLEVTPSGGLHWLYRVPTPRPNTKIARRPSTPEELAEHQDAERAKAAEIDDPALRTARLARIDALGVDRLPQVLVETRGAGGFTVIAPSSGRTHPTGSPWVTVKGDPASIPDLTDEERDTLYVIANMLDAMPVIEETVPRAPGPASTGVRPGDDYNARATWDDILTPHGWQRVKSFGPSCAGWVRPGKSKADGISATTGRNDGDNLYVFSTSTEFEAEKPYSKFAAYTLLEHGGDYSAAAKALRADGYGEPTPISPGNTPASLHALVGGQETQPAQPPRPSLSIVDGTSARVLEPATAARVAAAYGPTEDGIARALADTHGHNLRYCPQRGLWLHWTGARWEWDHAEHHRELIRAISRDLPEEDGWKSFKKRSLSASGVSGIARLAQSDARIVVHVDHLDARPYELNTPGGIIDLRTGELRPPDPTALHTRSTSVTPDFDQESETLTRFLADTFGGNDELTGYVQRLLGISVIGTVLEQILPFAHGSGANGKSTLTEAAMHALGRGEGGYAISAPSEMLMVRKHSEHPAELAQLAGARLVICSELDDGQRFAEARIKQLTGRDSINARFMRRDPFTFTPSHTIWLLGNHRPDTGTGGPAFWRRVQLIPFEHVVPEQMRDATLGERLEAEGAAVLAWIARGAADYMTSGLRTPAAVRSATAAYAHDQDTVGRFVEDSCHVAHGGGLLATSVTDLRSAYESWCHEEGATPVSARRLTQELRLRFGIESTKGAKGRRQYRGIGLASERGEEE